MRGRDPDSARRARRGALIGVTAVTGAVLGVGLLAGTTLLLHPGIGALASAGFLIALSLGALAAAFWVDMPEGGGGRGGRRWVGAVVAFLIASPFAEYWVREAGVRGAAWGRSLAVLLLLAFPAYTVGSVLAHLQRRERGAAVAALAGGAAGVLVAAVWLIPKFDPGINLAASAVVLVAVSWVEGVVVGGSGMGEGRDGAMEGKVAIVTGAGARGQVGYAVAEALLARGASVVMTARGADVEGLARELGERAAAVGVAADLTREEEAEQVVDLALREFGRLDLLVNVAGGLRVIKPLAETSIEEWSGEVERNARTAFLMSRAALPALRESRGAIINFASPAGLRARGGIGAYSAAKAAVVALTRALALEEKEHGVRVNAVAPGLIDTEENRAEMEDPESAGWVTREEVVEVVLFLASQRAAGVNGETIEVLGEGIG